MRLFLMRHADAVQGTKDRERPLSARGRQQDENRRGCEPLRPKQHADQLFRYDGKPHEDGKSSKSGGRHDQSREPA